MKKPFSIVDTALNVMRVCLVLGIFITLFDFFIRIDQNNAIVIRFPSSSETEETSALETSSINETTPISTAPVVSPQENGVLTSEPKQITAENLIENAAETPTYDYNSAVLQTTAAQTSSSEPAAESQSGLININTAPVRELVKLSGIGDVKAAAIVEYRSTYGNFLRIEDIMNVKGIGEKTFEKIKDQITV